MEGVELYELQIDIDEKENIKKKFEHITSILNICDFIEFKNAHIYETARGLHFYLTIQTKQPFDDIDMCMMQCLLGSDLKREAFNYKRIKSGIGDWNVLFQKKFKDGKVVSEEKRRKELEEKLINKIYEEVE